MKDGGTLAPYQIECVNDVFDKICNGKRRVTLLIPTGAGKLRIAVMLVEKVCTTYQKAVLVGEYEEIKKQCDEYIEKIGSNKVCCQTVTCFFDTQESYDMVVLIDIRAAFRVKLNDYFAKDDRAIVISIGTPVFGEDDRAPTVDYLVGDTLVEVKGELDDRKQLNRVYSYYMRIGKRNFLVYTTDNLIDIRDIFGGEKEEKERATQQFQKEKHNALCELYVLSNGLKKVSQPEIQCELKDMIQCLQRKVAYQAQLLASVGIPSELIDEEFKKIEELRKELSTSFYDEENTIVEATMAQFETVVAESITKLTARVIPVENSERYTDILKFLLSEKVWDRLTESSRRFLITAKINYDAFVQIESGENLDYSGVCLLITKVLDIEITKRIYKLYGEYLQEHYLCSSWPKAMYDKSTRTIIDKKDFTLGTVAYVIGCNKNGAIKNDKDFELFRKFAKEYLYVPEFTYEQCEISIRNVVKYVEKVRVDYRNPAAHRNSLNVVSAKECIDYMIETYKKLKEIL